MGMAEADHSASAPRRWAKPSLRARLWAKVPSPRWFRWLIYALYEQRLRARLANGPMPRHIGVVLDGNRRFAQLSEQTLAGGYRLGTKKVDELLRWCDDLQIRDVTIWTLSLDNLSRPSEELDDLIQVVQEGLPHLRDMQKQLVRPRSIVAVGRREVLPPALLRSVEEVERETADNGPFRLHIALGYGGREEIVDAVKGLLQAEAQRGGTLAEVAAQLTPQSISQHLYLSSVPAPDLIIRTSGEIRLSGFMLWGSAYSEYYFCDALWPSFRRIDLLRAIRSYQLRKRRFGQ